MTQSSGGGRCGIESERRTGPETHRHDSQLPRSHGQLRRVTSDVVATGLVAHDDGLAPQRASALCWPRRMSRAIGAFDPTSRPCSFVTPASFTTARTWDWT